MMMRKLRGQAGVGLGLRLISDDMSGNIYRQETLYTLSGYVEGTRWLKNGLPHRDNDLPAVEYVNGTNEWWYNGQRHRENNLPAIENVNGTKEWFYHDERHREGGEPAIENVNGTKEWWYHGQRHREGGEPAVEKANGTKEWWYNDERHRENDLPAVKKADRTKEWWYHGKRHREGGEPAVEKANGKREWWYNDERHRDGDLPAIDWRRGEKIIFQHWFRHGMHHREGDQPASVVTNVLLVWYYNNEKHREGDQPAVIYAHGGLEWWYHGNRHRMGGPAVVNVNPNTQQAVPGFKQYWFNGFHFRDPNVYWKRIQLMTPEEPFTSDLSRAVDMAMEDTFDYEFQTEKQKREERLGRELTQQEQVELEDEVQQYIVQNVTDHMHEFRAEVMEREAPLMEELREDYPPASRWAGRIHIT